MKKTITTLLLTYIVISTTAQVPYTNNQLFNSNYTNETMFAPYYLGEADVNTPTYPQHQFNQRKYPSIKNNNSTKYPVSGVSFNDKYLNIRSTYDYFHDTEGNHIKTIGMGVNGIDSIAHFFSANSRNFGYYSYVKNADGGYDPNYYNQRIFSSPNDNGSDSVYYEDISYIWNKQMNRWDNYSKTHFDYFSADYFSRYAIGAYSSIDGTDWVGLFSYRIGRVVHNSYGYIEKLYLTSHDGVDYDTLCIEYKYNSDGSYYEILYEIYRDGSWELNAKTTNIQWQEYHGFTSFPHNTDFISLTPEPVPFSAIRNKPTFYSIYYYLDGEWEHITNIKIDWFDDTYSQIITQYRKLNGLVTEYPWIVNTEEYNEHGDFYKSTGTVYTAPNEFGQQTIEQRSTTALYELTYEEDYGLSGERLYYISHDNQTWLPNDTMFVYGNQITEFSTTPNIWLPIEEYTPTNNITLSLYPNPATNQVTITGIKAGDMIVVSDISGRQVMQLRATSEEQTIDISTLRAGIYVLSSGNARGKLVVSD